jgi:NAD(P)H-flavin reductase
MIEAGVPSEVARGDPMLPRPYRIRRASRELADTFTLELAPQDGGDACRFAPGQFNMLYVYGVGEVPISISGDPRKRGVFVHTVRAVGSVTQAMQTLKRDAILGVRGPFGSSWPVEAAERRDLVIVAGGIGLAPLRPVMLHVLARRDRYDKVLLLYGTRRPEDLLFRRELERWRARLDLEIFVTVDRATEAWRGNVGVVTTLISRISFDPARAIAMVCGPEVMMRFTALELANRGVPPEQIHVSVERNMKCAIGLCGHCQWGSNFICKDGPVFPYGRVRELLSVWEL